MNHLKNIAERVKLLEEKADLEASDAATSSTTDLATIVRDLASEVSLLAKLMAERHERTSSVCAENHRPD